MIAFPNAKINIGLNVIGKRADGFHDLETIFYPVRLQDAVEIVEAPEPEVTFTTSGNKIPGNAADNLCLRAFHLVKSDHPNLPSVKIHLHKNIPSGAGLGGGSADAATVLQVLNKKFELNISADKMHEYALLLGSDCPFFLYNKPALATGRGEVLVPIDVDLSEFDILIINPHIHVSTAAAFSACMSEHFSIEGRLENIDPNPINWRGTISNSFEEIVFSKHPEIRKIKEQLYRGNALYSAMSGSGSSIFGIFEKGKARNISMPANYFTQIV